MRPSFWNFVIATSEIIGGIFGLIISRSFYLLFASLALSSKIIILYMVAGYALSVTAGILLALHKRIGTLLSILVQFIQIPHVALKGFKYIFISGIELSSGVEIPLSKISPTFSFSFYIFKAHAEIDLSYDQTLFIGINIAALLAMRHLIREYRAA